MSSNETIPQEQEPEEETPAANSAQTDEPDPDTSEGDRPIIIQGG
jgi:hypothetical protein